MYRFCRAVLGFLCRILFRMSYEGTENIPESGSYIVAANHHSLVDPLFIAMCFKRQIFYMAKAELYENRFMGAWLRALGAFPVSRGTGDRTAISRAVELARDGKLIGIFPEGTRSRSGAPLRPKSGAAYIAGEAQCGIIPCAVVFDGSLRIGRRVKVMVGKPLEYSELGFSGSRSDLKRVSKLIMAEILELMGCGQLPQAVEGNDAPQEKDSQQRVSASAAAEETSDRGGENGR